MIFPAPVTPGGDEEAAALETALAMLEEHADSLAGFIFEPLVQGAAGMKMHSAHFINTLAKRARELGILLIADEVAVGFGRTGTLFASEHLDFEPDFLCLAKGISGGYLPLAVTMATEHVYEAFLGLPEEGKQFFHGHTYTGQSAGLCCGTGFTGIVRKRECPQSHQHSDSSDCNPTRTHGFELMVTRIANVAYSSVSMSSKSMARMHPRETGHQISMAARPLGAILRPLGNTIVLNPPLSMTEEEIDLLLDITERACNQVLGEPNGERGIPTPLWGFSEPTPDENAIWLPWLVRLRWVAIVTQAVMISFAFRVLWSPWLLLLSAVIIGLTVGNLDAMRILRQGREITSERVLLRLLPPKLLP